MTEAPQTARFSLHSLLLAIRRESNFIKSLAIKLAKEAVDQSIPAAQFVSRFPKVSPANWELAKSELLIAKSRAVRPLSIFDAEYPAHLREIPDPPLLLFVRGDLPRGIFTQGRARQPCIAIVGMRDANQEGMQHALALGEQLTKLGALVVSGLAFGIDSAAHRGAILAAEQTVTLSAGIAVLGSGVCNVTPSANEQLAELLLKQRGALMSEYAVYADAHKYTFPERNRIISGLCDATLIIQADWKSGSRITANCALEQGREVLAMPGPVGDRRYAGTNQLLKEGALVLTGLNDVLDIFPQLKRKLETNASESVDPKKLLRPSERRADQNDRLLISLSSDQQESARKILQMLDQCGASSFDNLIAEVAIDSSALSSVLGLLEVLGAITSMPGNTFTLRNL